MNISRSYSHTSTVEKAMVHMLIGARKECVHNAADIRETMTILKQLGYDFLELGLGREQIANLSADSAADYVAGIESTGLPILSTSFGHFGGFAAMAADERNQVLSHVRSFIGFTQAIGADVMLMATQESDGQVADYATIYRELLGPIADTAAVAGVTLALEHVGAYKPSTLARLVRAIDHPAVRIYFDMGNCLYVGENPLEQARICAPLTAQIHIKGGPVAPLAAMPLTEVRHILQAAGFDGRGCLEIEAGPGNRPLNEARGLLKMTGYTT